jgi:hypothetical protein
VLQFGRRADALATLLRDVAANIEDLGEGAEILDVSIRPDTLSADVYFSRDD